MFSRSVRAVARPGFTSSLGAAPAISRPALGAVRHYHEKVLDHYQNPRNVGSMDKSDQHVGTGLVGAPACGDVMKLQIKIDPETGKISQAVFKTFGCGSAIASSSYMTELIRKFLFVYSR
jgi:iron-sulfur cluster assembly enzyme ISCU, mitochondrial